MSRLRIRQTSTSKRSKNTSNPSSADHWRRDLNAFQSALTLNMRRCGDTLEVLLLAAAQTKLRIHGSSITGWVRGKSAPRSKKSYKFLSWLECRYGLPDGYFHTALYGNPDSPLNVALRSRTGHARSQLRFHLPSDFERRTEKQRGEIIQWIEKNILPASSDYGKYIKRVTSQPFGLRFPDIIPKSNRGQREGIINAAGDNSDKLAIDAPLQLSTEIAALVKFKMDAFTPLGMQRKSCWSPVTARSKVHQLGLVFGTLSAPAKSHVCGFGISRDRLTLALLAFPSLVDRYLEWCRRRRGFFTRFEQSFLNDLRSFSRAGTGWMAQHPELAAELGPVPDFINCADVAAARRDWAGTCARLHQYAKDRSRDLGRIIRQHRDPFAPIIVILNSDSPLGEYRKIADEVLRWMPSEFKKPKAAAESMRAYLLLRMGMHLGLRQRNLRELLICLKDDEPETECQLEALGCGEMRWDKHRKRWEVFIPCSAFKNSGSSFFMGNPFRLMLPDLEHLYSRIDKYLKHHRPLLLGSKADPGTFFVKTVKPSTESASFDAGHFHRMWRETVQRYGIYNPFTKRGVIKGLLPHGPHSVRDVLATHILKQTGSYDLASYAIQDTPRMVIEHYGRFLPQDKTAQAAQILDRIWSLDIGPEALQDLARSIKPPVRSRPFLDRD